MQFFGIESETAPFAGELAFALAAARRGSADDATLDRLNKLSGDPEIVVRGYAAWALHQLRAARLAPREYHINPGHPRADDGNLGSADTPWRTIQKAAELALPGDTVVIHAGLYREWVRPYFGGRADASITYTSAAGEEPPVLTAADLWENEWQDEGDGLYSGPYQRHPWDCPEKWSHPVKGAMHRSEQIIVNGTLLRHVDGREALAEQPGSFWTDDEAGRVWIHLEGKTQPAGCVIERVNRQQVFAPVVRGLGYLRLNGLVFRYGAAPEWYGDSRPEIGQRAVVSVRAGHHWLIENNVIEWGNAQGLDVGTGGSYGAESAQPRVDDQAGFHVVRNNRVNHHAVAGIVGTGGVVDLLLEGNETSFNGWKGNFEGYEAAGLKLHAADRCIIRRHRAHRNESFGIWLDWDCRRNRVTQCIMTENLAAGFFHEASPGPLLVDGNVILDTRALANGDWGDGIYCHDGNHATFYGNYVARSAGYGVRLKVLFGREFNGKPTTADGNRVFNNILVDNRGALSLHPEGDLFAGNVSDTNLLWDPEGRAPLMQLEDGGSGVAWEDTEIGRFLGRSGGGNLALNLPEWCDVFRQDKASLVLPLKALEASSLLQAESTETLEAVLRQLSQVLPDGLGRQEDVGAVPANELAGAVVPRLHGYRWEHTFWLGPVEALEVWRGERDAVEIAWRGTGEVRLGPLRDPALLEAGEPDAAARRVLSAGEEAELGPVGPGAKLLATPRALTAGVEGGRLRVRVADDAAAGRYQLLWRDSGRWQAAGIEVAAPLRLLPLETRFVRSPLLRGVLVVPVQNRSGRAVPVSVEIRFQDEVQRVTGDLAPESIARFEFPIEKRIAGVVQLRIESAVQTIAQAEKVSFVVAPAADDWQPATWHDLAVFSDGTFPAGAQAFILFENGLSGRFALRHDAAGLHLRLEANDRHHQQTAPDWQLYLEDSVEILLKPPAGPGYRGPFLFHLALHTTDERQILKFRDRSQTPGSPDAPANLATSHVGHAGGVTTYDLLVPWAMLNLPGAPAPAADPVPVRLSLLLNNNDGYDRHGFQWFFGIFHHSGEDERMGTIWLA